MTSSFLAGAEISTFLTEPPRCALAFSASVKKPVDSMTTSMSWAAQSMPAGSFSEKTLMSSPSTFSPSPVASTVPG